MYLFLCVSVLCLMFLCVIPVLCLWALLPELKLMMMMMMIKTILKPRVSAAAVRANTYTRDFPDVKFRLAAQLAGSLGKACESQSTLHF